MKYLKYIALLPVIADVIDTAKSIRKGKTASSSVPLSIEGVRGTLTVSWVADNAGALSV